MIRRFIFMLCIAISVCGFAQAEISKEGKDSIQNIVEAINIEDGSIFIEQSDALNKILAKPAENDKKESGTAVHRGNQGYRIQIFSDNNIRTAKSNAEYRKRLVANRMPSMRTYLTFEAPYWRVRVGDFYSRGEADAALRSLKSAFPSFAGDMRVIRSRINPAAAH